MDELEMKKIAEEVADAAIKKHVAENIYFGHIFGAIFLSIQLAMVAMILVMNKS